MSDVEKEGLLKKENLLAAKSYESIGAASNFHCHDEEERKGDESNRRAKRTLWISLTICLFFMICEVVGGWWAQSLAIITDAAHLLTDFASMLISLFSLYLASRPASRRMSFGFQRAEVLGAFVSVFLIWIVTGILVYLAVMRIINGDYEIEGSIMAITAGIGVCVNLVMGAMLYFGGHPHSHLGGGSHGHSHGGHSNEHEHEEEEEGHGHSHGGESHDHSEGDAEEGHGHSKEGSDSSASGHKHSEQNINVRAAFIHVIGDLIQSVGVLVAALVIFFFPDWSVVDPICTLFFSIIVLFTTIYIMRDALVVLLEGRPSNIDFSLVFQSLGEIPGVQKVHDLRIWALTMDKVALSVHLEINKDAKAQKVLKATRYMLKNKFSVFESTVQIENYATHKSDCEKHVIMKKWYNKYCQIVPDHVAVHETTDKETLHENLAEEAKKYCKEALLRKYRLDIDELSRKFDLLASETQVYGRCWTDLYQEIAGRNMNCEHSEYIHDLVQVMMIDELIKFGDEAQTDIYWSNSQIFQRETSWNYMKVCDDYVTKTWKNYLIFVNKKLNNPENAHKFRRYLLEEERKLLDTLEMEELLKILVANSKILDGVGKVEYTKSRWNRQLGLAILEMQQGGLLSWMCLPVYFQNAIDLKELIEKYAVVLKAEQEGDAYDISSAKLEMYHLQYKQLCRDNSPRPPSEKEIALDKTMKKFFDAMRQKIMESANQL
ncbi:cdf-2 [Pristionchus pacificus]|uniref:Ttm-1 n=1 Tax=Pristionchus pacificus TaxID=54126 RepID=A0A2A6D066_PRIPA|nr:cdf-2 [Pristionchus pacificus]|eukprot:PDM83760.1 ttm-1 [Pristionchus pacificus]